jgi:hypothetical protein
MRKFIESLRVFIHPVILHAGTNDVNKCNKPSQIQLIKAKLGEEFI